MPRRAFFTPNMGARLRQLRMRALHTQNELALRMGLEGPQRRAGIRRLEGGLTASPTLELIARYLRACGAGWSEITDLLDAVEIPGIDPKVIDDSHLPEPDKNQVARATQEQVGRFTRKLARRSQGKPLHPAQQAAMAERLRNFRLTANVIEQHVLVLLRTTELPTMSYPRYRAVARHCIGQMWRYVRKHGRAQTLAEVQAPGKERWPAEVAAALEAKQAGWRKQRLDLALVLRVEAKVQHWFMKLLQEHEELFPDVTPAR